MKWGKWLGGGLGWAFGGPIGALLGFAFGAVVDSLQTVRLPAGQQTMQGDFTVSLLILSASVMKADGKVLRSELDFVKSFFFRQFGPETGAHYLRMLRDILKQDIPLRDVCIQISQYMEYPLRLQLLHYLYGIASADGEVHTTEINVIAQIADYLGIDTSDAASIRAMFVKDAGAAYKILEIPPDASDAELKNAYRSMAQKYHPDKVTHLGPEMQKAAQEKFQKLNAAYNEIKKQRGIG